MLNQSEVKCTIDERVGLTFRSVMNNFSLLSMQMCTSFFYDVLIFSKSEAWTPLLSSIGVAASEATKRSKCTFALPEIDYLWHVINAQAVAKATDPWRIGPEHHSTQKFWQKSGNKKEETSRGNCSDEEEQRRTNGDEERGGTRQLLPKTLF